MNDTKLRMYCIVSEEAVKATKGNRGKMLAQAGHAYLHSFWDAQRRFPKMAQDYQESPRAYKIALKVAGEAELRVLHKTYAPLCGGTFVVDAALTVFEDETVTCIGIGPIPEELIGEDLFSLKLFI